MRIATVAALAAYLTAVCHGQLNYIGGPVSQNFDTLSSSGTGNPWTNNSTLPGWYWLRAPSSTVGRQVGGWIDLATYNASDGSSTTGAGYSFGTSGTSERALGTIGSGNAASGDYVYALVIRNMSGLIMTSFTLSYVGEQWRNGGNTSMAPQTVEFDFKIQSTFASTDLNGDITSGYVADPLLSFTSPINTSTAGALNGNLAVNRVALSNTQSVVVASGDYLILRWFDDNHAGNDHGLAADDLLFTATLVPEPGTLAALALGALALAARRRRK